MEGLQPQVRRGIAAAALMSVPALGIAAVLLLWQLDPVALGRILGRTDWLLDRGAWLAIGLVPAALIALAVYPPAWPLLRIWWDRQKARMSFDRKAARDLLQRLQEFPNAKDLQSLGELYVHAHAPVQAVGPLANAAKLEPDNPRVLYLLAQCFRQLGRHAEAMAAVQAALSHEPDIAFGEGLLLGADLALRLGDAARARELAEEHGRRFGETIRGMLVFARAAHRSGDREACKDALGRLLELEPGSGKRFSPAEAYCRARARLARLSGRTP